MLNFLLWLGGYVYFRYEKGFVEGFINDCYEHSLNVQNLVRDNGALNGKCSARTYLRLHRIARKNGGVIGITKRHGPIFILLKLRNRLGLIIGALFVVLIINFLSGFVWNIQIVGNNKIPTADLSAFLNDNGVSTGVFANNIDRDVVENLIMATFDDCAWAHINIDGTTAVLEIDEVVKKPQLVDKKLVTNVKAKRDGIIVSAVAYDGCQAVKAGDMVKKGDMLISGIYQREDGYATHYAHARGRVIANVDEEFNMTISRQQCKKKYTDTKIFKSIYFFGARIPLYFGSSKFINSDVEETADYAILNDKRLPIGVVKKQVKRFDVYTQILSDKELNELVNSEIDRRINKEYANMQIIKKDINVSLDSDKAVAKGTVTCLQDIGKEVKVRINNK